MSDRTKIHPRYWHREGRALAVLDTLDGLPLAGSIGGPQAIEQSWAHADALIREGYMLALERVALFGDKLKGDCALSDEERYILAQAAEVLELEAPGEAE